MSKGVPLTVEEIRRRNEAQKRNDATRDAAGRLHLGGSRRFKVLTVRWPSQPDLEVGIRPLMDQDIADAEAEAAAAVAKLPGEIGAEGTLRHREYGYAIQAAILYRAIVDASDKVTQLWKTMADLRADSSREDLNRLSFQYADHQEQTQGLLRHTDEARFRELWALLKKTHDLTWFDALSRSTQRDFMRSMVLLLDESPGRTSSTSTSDGSQDTATSGESTASDAAR